MLEIFQSAFMVRAFWAGIIIAVIAPLIGIFLVVRRYSLIADTLAHVSLVGVALGVLLNINPVLMATGTTVFASFNIEKLRKSKKIFGESILALFLSGSLAIVAILVSLTNGFKVNLLSYLFGSIVTVNKDDLFIISVLSVFVILTILLFYKELFAVAFDEELAKASGIKADFFNFVIILLAAITVSLAMRIVGILLVGALMIIPVISAIQFGKSFLKTIFLGIAFSLIAVIIGLFIAYYQDLAPGGTIILVALTIFIVSLIWNRKK